MEYFTSAVLFVIGTVMIVFSKRLVAETNEQFKKRGELTAKFIPSLKPLFSSASQIQNSMSGFTRWVIVLLGVAMLFASYAVIYGPIQL